MRKPSVADLAAAPLVSLLPAGALADGCGARPYLGSKSALGETRWEWEFCISQGETWNLGQDSANTEPAKTFRSSVLKVAKGVHDAWEANFSIARPVASRPHIQWGSPASGMVLARRCFGPAS